jgi:hypothetical protein
VLLKPLPWPDADRLVRVSESRQGHEPRVRGMINGTYIAWHDQPATIRDRRLANAADDAIVGGATRRVSRSRR